MNDVLVLVQTRLAQIGGIIHSVEYFIKLKIKLKVSFGDGAKDSSQQEK